MIFILIKNMPFKTERNSRQVCEMELETPPCPWDLFLPFSLFAFFSFSLFVKILNTPKKLQKKKNFHKIPSQDLNISGKS